MISYCNLLEDGNLGSLFSLNSGAIEQEIGTETLRYRFTDLELPSTGVLVLYSTKIRDDSCFLFALLRVVIPSFKCSVRELSSFSNLTSHLLNRLNHILQAESSSSQILMGAKKRNPGKSATTSTRGKQLRYLRRNLKHINRILDQIQQSEQTAQWKFCDWQLFWVLQELYRQQAIMHRDGRKRIDDRIINIAQPYVRPIKRGKAGKLTEFGAKLSVSQTEGLLKWISSTLTTLMKILIFTTPGAS